MMRSLAAIRATNLTSPRLQSSSPFSASTFRRRPSPPKNHSGSFGSRDLLKTPCTNTRRILIPFFLFSLCTQQYRTGSAPFGSVTSSNPVRDARVLVRLDEEKASEGPSPLAYTRVRAEPRVRTEHGKIVHAVVSKKYNSTGGPRSSHGVEERGEGVGRHGGEDEDETRRANGRVGGEAARRRRRPRRRRHVSRGVARERGESVGEVEARGGAGGASDGGGAEVAREDARAGLARRTGTHELPEPQPDARGRSTVVGASTASAGNSARR